MEYIGAQSRTLKMTNFITAAMAAQGDSIDNPLVTVEGVSALANYIGTFWQAAYIVSGLLLLAYLIFGALRFMTAGGDEKGVTEAKAMITNAVIGLVILAASFPIIRMVEVVLGINILQITWPTV